MKETICARGITKKVFIKDSWKKSYTSQWPKKIMQAENLPSPPITFLVVHPYI
jgi:hypothetical protein